LASRRPLNHFRILTALLYSRHAWVERGPDGALTADSTRFAQLLGLRTSRLHDALAHLKEIGYLDRLIWHQKWFLAQPACPPGLARVAGVSPGTSPAEPSLDEVIDV
jgi:hypothetical protein